MAAIEPEGLPAVRLARLRRLRARETLGWEPRVPLDDGLKRTIEYFRGVVDK